jgi:hypothetical protein
MITTSKRIGVGVYPSGGNSTMAEHIEDKKVLDDLEREVQPTPLPSEPTEPTEPGPSGDPGKAQPANGGWGSQDIPVPAN